MIAAIVLEENEFMLSRDSCPFIIILSCTGPMLEENYLDSLTTLFLLQWHSNKIFSVLINHSITNPLKCSVSTLNVGH